MTAYSGMSKSNYVEVSDKQQLQDFVDWVFKINASYFQTYWSGDKFAIGCDNGPMSIDETRLDMDDFFAVLGDCIAEPMVIRSVGYEGMRYTPDAWQWVVYPDGTWTYTGFDDAHTVKQKYESEELSGQVVNERTDS